MLFENVEHVEMPVTSEVVLIDGNVGYETEAYFMIALNQVFKRLSKA